MAINVGVRKIVCAIAMTSAAGFGAVVTVSAKVTVHAVVIAVVISAGTTVGPMLCLAGSTVVVGANIAFRRSTSFDSIFTVAISVIIGICKPGFCIIGVFINTVVTVVVNAIAHFGRTRVHIGVVVIAILIFCVTIFVNINDC
jgi:hypothetical protein